MYQYRIDDIVAALSAVRMPAQPEEYDIHAAIARARIDFRVGRIGIEVKKGRPASSELVRQLRKYMESDDLDAVIVVTQRATALPGTICGKPVALISLNRLWGVALP